MLGVTVQVIQGLLRLLRTSAWSSLYRPRRGAVLKVQDSVGVCRHAGDDVGRRANSVDATDHLAHEYGGGIEMLRSDSGLKGAHRIGQRRQQCRFIVMPA